MADQLPDIRLSTGFWNHRKTKRVRSACGSDGFRSLVVLFSQVRCSRPDGDLAGLTDDDIEAEADWDGEPGKFVKALKDCGWIDGKPKAYKMHDWEVWQPWSVGAYDRSLWGFKANLEKQIQDGKISKQDAISRLKRREKALRQAQAQGLPPASASLTESERQASEQQAASERGACDALAAPLLAASPPPYPLPIQASVQIEREGAGRENDIGQTELLPKPAPTVKRKKVETELPPDFGISDRVKAWAAEKGHGQLKQRLEHFIGYAKAKAARYVDWDEAFMNSIRSDWAKLNGRNGAAGPAQLDPHAPGYVHPSDTWGEVITDPSQIPV